MNTRRNLYLHEEVMLLALKDEKGTVASSVPYPYAIGGAILAELLLGKRIKVDDSKRRKLANLADSRPFKESILDECLNKIVKAKRRASLRSWVSRFAQVKRLKHRVAESLCRQGILRADEDTVLLIFKRKVYPELNPSPERKIIDRLRRAVFSDAGEIEPRTVVLLSIASSAGLLKLVFDKKKLRSRKARIKSIVDGELTGKATKEAIEAMHAAVAVAAVIPAVVVATTASH